MSISSIHMPSCNHFNIIRISSSCLLVRLTQSILFITFTPEQRINTYYIKSFHIEKFSGRIFCVFFSKLKHTIQSTTSTWNAWRGAHNTQIFQSTTIPIAHRLEMPVEAIRVLILQSTSFDSKCLERRTQYSNISVDNYSNSTSTWNTQPERHA